MTRTTWIAALGFALATACSSAEAPGSADAAVSACPSIWSWIAEGEACSENGLSCGIESDSGGMSCTCTGGSFHCVHPQCVGPVSPACCAPYLRDAAPD